MGKSFELNSLNELLRACSNIRSSNIKSSNITRYRSDYTISAETYGGANTVTLPIVIGVELPDKPKIFTKVCEMIISLDTISPASETVCVKVVSIDIVNPMHYKFIDIENIPTFVPMLMDGCIRYFKKLQTTNNNPLMDKIQLEHCYDMRTVTGGFGYYLYVPFLVAT